MSYTTEPHYQKVEKPWGHELIYTPENLSYAGKVLFIKGGNKISFQYHDKKIETLCLFSGEALIWLEDNRGEIKKISMEPFKGYTVAVGQKHRVEAIQDSYVLESSMPETGTTVRVEDDFSRPNETEDLRKEDNRGWQG